jgi:hypothetical protein
MKTQDLKVVIKASVGSKIEKHEMVKSYTMIQHFYDVPLKDAHAYLRDTYGNQCGSDSVIQLSPIVKPEIEELILAHLGLLGELLIPKIHNPMHSAFDGYRKQNIGGIDILTKSVSAGLCYAIFNHEWYNENFLSCLQQKDKSESLAYLV